MYSGLIKFAESLFADGHIPIMSLFADGHIPIMSLFADGHIPIILRGPYCFFFEPASLIVLALQGIISNKLVSLCSSVLDRSLL